jgi:hypothetical protein
MRRNEPAFEKLRLFLARMRMAGPIGPIFASFPDFPAYAQKMCNEPFPARLKA